MSAPLRAAALVLALTGPGCITAGLWEWEGETAPRFEAPVAVDGTTRPLEDDDLATTVRYADGEREVVRWSWEPGDAAGPDAQRERAEAAAARGDRAAAVAHLEAAVRRGLGRRGLAAAPGLAPLRDDPALARLDATPRQTPLVALGPAPTAEDGGLPPAPTPLVLAPPDPPERVATAGRRVEVPAGGPLRTAAALLATPLTFALDVATAPVQLVMFLVVLDALEDLFGD